MTPMNVCRFKNQQGETRVGLAVDDQTVIDLTAGGIRQMSAILESADPAGELRKLAEKNLPRVAQIGRASCRERV